MAPLPHADPGLKGNSLSAFFSDLKSKLKSYFRSSSEKEPHSLSSRFPSTGLSRPYDELPFGTPPKTEKKVEWGFTDLTDTDEYKETLSNPWSYHRKRSLQSLEPPAMTLTGTGIGAPGQEQPGRRPLTVSQDISLLILTWLAALLVCGMIVWIIAKTKKKLYRLVDQGMIGLEEKNGWRWALHWVGFSAIVVTVVAALLTLIALIFSLKGLLGGAI